MPTPPRAVQHPAAATTKIKLAPPEHTLSHMLAGFAVWAAGMRSRAARLEAGGHVHWAACHLLAARDVEAAVAMYMWVHDNVQP